MFSLLGIFVMISGHNFLVIYMGLELMTLSSYALVALRRDNATASCRATIPSRASTTTVHRYYVRERTQFVYRDLFVSSKFESFDDVTYDGFLANLIGVVFDSYRPTWTYYRDERGHNLKDGGGNATEPFALRVHRICDRYTNVKTCLYSNDSPLVLRDDVSLRKWLAENPCGELAVVFV